MSVNPGDTGKKEDFHSRLPVIKKMSILVLVNFASVRFSSSVSQRFCFCLGCPGWRIYAKAIGESFYEEDLCG